MAIYLKEFREKPPDSIEELITVFQTYKHSNGYDYIGSRETYSNPECTKIECYGGRYRSIDALVELSRTYFPDITEKEIFTSLFNLVIEISNRI